MKTCLCIRRRYIQTHTGHKFWADPASHFGLEILRAGTYEPQMTRLLELVLRPCDTFVDVGGNEGYFSVVAAALVPQGKIHCIEPQTRLQPVLQKTIEANGAQQVTVHQLAFASMEGEVDLYLRPTIMTGASSMFRYWKIGSAKERVRAVTLDSLSQRDSRNYAL